MVRFELRERKKNGVILIFEVLWRDGIQTRVIRELSLLEQRKKPSYFPLYWFVNRDPYNGLL